MPDYQKIFIISSALWLATPVFAGATLIVTLNDAKSSQLTWQCEDVTECVERIITRVEERGTCSNTVKKIEITQTHIPGFDD